MKKLLTLAAAFAIANAGSRNDRLRKRFYPEPVDHVCCSLEQRRLCASSFHIEYDDGDAKRSGDFHPIQ